MKLEDEQMIHQIMDTDTMGYASVYDSGSGKREEYLVALTAENLASLIGGKGGEARQITVTDVLDRLVAESRRGGDAGQLPGSETVQEDKPVPGTNPEGRKRGRGDPGRKQGGGGRILCSGRGSGHPDRVPDAVK